MRGDVFRELQKARSFVHRLGLGLELFSFLGREGVESAGMGFRVRNGGWLLHLCTDADLRRSWRIRAAWFSVEESCSSLVRNEVLAHSRSVFAAATCYVSVQGPRFGDLIFSAFLYYKTASHQHSNTTVDGKEDWRILNKHLYSLEPFYQLYTCDNPSSIHPFRTTLRAQPQPQQVPYQHQTSRARTSLPE